MEYTVKINGQLACQPNKVSEVDHLEQGPTEKNDLCNMQSSLQKLKGLSKDDKTENAMLRSRIDEQSQLIMILKQRADEAILRTQTLEKINKELSEFRENAAENLQHEIRKYNILDARFNDLASNHEEMIKFKDEYKRVNSELRQENSRLREENRQLFSGALQEKDAVIADMDSKMKSLREQCSALESKHRQMLQEARNREDTLRNEVKTLQDQYRSEVKSLQAKIKDTEERLKGANYKLQNVIQSQASTDADSQNKLQTLIKEKDELLDLAMSRGKLIQKEQTENKKLLKKIEEMEKAVRNMEEKFEREAAMVNANKQVRKLREELDEAETGKSDITKQFEAFKKHSNDLLKKEKELNERLRHLVG